MLLSRAVSAGRVPRLVVASFRRLSVTASAMPPVSVEWSKEAANSVTFIGTLGTDPRVRVLPSGKKVCSSRLAVRATGSKQDDATDWFGLDAWDDEGGKAQLATQMEMFCTKGQRVQVTGRLKFESYTNKLGEAVTEPKIVINDLKLIAPGLNRAESGAASPSGFSATPRSSSGGGGASSSFPSSAQRGAPTGAEPTFAPSTAVPTGTRPPQLLPRAQPEQKDRLGRTSAEIQQMWFDVYDQYGEWDDVRANIKTRGDEPDFVHKTKKGWALNLELDDKYMPADVWNYFNNASEDGQTQGGGETTTAF